jgi:hypothetical protein
MPAWRCLSVDEFEFQGDDEAVGYALYQYVVAVQPTVISTARCEPGFSAP